MKKNKSNLLMWILGVLLGVFIFTTLMLTAIVIGQKDHVLCDCFVPNCAKDYDKVIELDIDDVNVRNLFGMAHGPMNMGAGYNQFPTDKMLASEIPYEEKLFFASTRYAKSIYNSINYNTMVTTYYLNADAVKSALEYVFGDVEYKQVDKVPYLCGYLNYDSKSNQYIGTLGCGGNIGGGTTEEVIKAEKINDLIEITSATAYYGPGSVDYELYKDSSSEMIVGLSTPEEMHEYIKNNPEKFNNYKYTFKLNENGFYKFHSIEKVK